MAVNKVEFGDQVVMDITDSTVSPEKLLSGETAYDRSGAKITGSLVTKDISIETKRSTGENVATISLDNTDYDIYALSEEEVADLISGEQEATGNPVVLKTLIGGDAKSCSVGLLPIQDLHGYDSPWVGGARGNYLAGLKDGTYEGNGAKAVVKNGVATLSGTTTASGNALVIPLDKEVTLPNEQIYYHCMNSVANSNLGPSIEKNGQASSTSISVALSPVNKIVEVNSVRWGVTVDQVRFYIASGVTLSGTYAPMIMKTNTATDFIPYENNCPISGRTELNLAVRGGVNQWDEQWEMGGYNQLTGAKQSSTTTIRNKNKILVEGGVDYYFVIPNTGIRYFTYSKYGYIETNLLRSSGILRFGSNVKYINFQMNGTTYENNISMNYPSTDTSYHAHKGETYTETLGLTYYGGKVDFVNGKLTIGKEYRLFNGTENWQVNGTGTDHYFYYINLGSSDYAVQGDIISDKFKPASVSQYNTTVGVAFCTPQYIRIRPFSTELSVSDWKTWLQSNNVQIAFGIQTPIEITLTPEKISLLKGNNVISTDGDSIDITWQNIPDIEDITPIKPLDYSTSEQITGQKWIDGSDIYRRTFTGTIDSNTHGTTEIADFTNLQPIACNGWFMDTSGVGMALGYFPNSTSWASALHIDSNHKLILFTESALAAGTYYVTVDYIKTT